jgi:uncharacterized membrane protein YidH (DUF202 family)
VTAFPGRDALQPERTALAWQRTSITATVVMVPLIVVNLRLGSWLMTVLGALATSAAVVLAVRVRRRFSQLRDDPRSFSPYAPMAGVLAVTTLAALMGLLTALVLILS